MYTITSITGARLLAGGPGSWDPGHRDRGGMHRDGVPWMGIVGLVVLVALGVLAVTLLRRSSGSVERRRQEWEDWHRAAHAGPVPTSPPPYAVAAPVTTPVTPSTPPAPAPAPAPAAPPAPAVPPAPDAPDAATGQTPD